MYYGSRIWLCKLQRAVDEDLEVGNRHGNEASYVHQGPGSLLLWPLVHPRLRR